jgi:hypothetical protein
MYRQKEVEIQADEFALQRCLIRESVATRTERSTIGVLETETSSLSRVSFLKQTANWVCSIEDLDEWQAIHIAHIQRGLKSGFVITCPEPYNPLGVFCLL